MKTKYTKEQTEAMTTREKLLALAKYLSRVKEEKFNLGIWAEVDAIPLASSVPFSAVKCGTSACACGHATSLFPHLRLRFRYDYDAEFVYRPSANWKDKRQVEYGWFEAAEKFFGVTKREAEYMFNPTCDAEGSLLDTSKKAVIGRIREVAKRYN